MELQRRSVRTSFLCFLCSLALSAPAAAQRVFDEWPVRTSAGPDALLRGVEAVYWNPAAIQTRAKRGELLVTDQRTPEVIGIGGFGVALAWRLDVRTTIAAGYQRVSIDDIGETSESPLPDPGISPTFSIGEDQLTFGVSHKVNDALSVGAGGRYDRSDEAGFDQSTTSLTAGILILPAISFINAFTPAAGGSIIAHRDGIRWSGGVDFALPRLSNVTTRLGYGVRGGEGMPGPEHRMGVTALWREMVSLTAGLMNGSGGGERVWEPTLGASLRVSRYELGALRESLSNEFGAAYAFRLRVGID
jgi:hypothetical protein